jgi:DNA-binding NarL/FixJ family response regulator
MLAQTNTDHPTAVLLDQHPLWLDALETMLERAGVAVVAKATRPADAVRLVESEHPDLLILDIEATGVISDGLDVMRDAAERLATLRIIVVSANDAAHCIDAAFTHGAAAYVLKRAHPDDFALAIRQTFETSLFLRSDRTQPARGSRTSDSQARLTSREQEILALVAEGRTNHEVAALLWVTEQTVKFHLANVYRKLGVANRTQASSWAHANGLLDDRARVSA